MNFDSWIAKAFDSFFKSSSKSGFPLRFINDGAKVLGAVSLPFFLTLVRQVCCILTTPGEKWQDSLPNDTWEDLGSVDKIRDSGVFICCCYTTCWGALGRWFTSVSLSFPICKVSFCVCSLMLSEFSACSLLPWLLFLLLQNDCYSQDKKFSRPAMGRASKKGCRFHF